MAIGQPTAGRINHGAAATNWAPSDGPMMKAVGDGDVTVTVYSPPTEAWNPTAFEKIWEPLVIVSDPSAGHVPTETRPGPMTLTSSGVSVGNWSWLKERPGPETLVPVCWYT